MSIYRTGSQAAGSYCDLPTYIAGEVKIREPRPSKGRRQAQCKGTAAVKSKGQHGMGHVYPRGKKWWIKYHKDGKPYYESSGSPFKQAAIELLKKMNERNLWAFESETIRVSSCFERRTIRCFEGRSTSAATRTLFSGPEVGLRASEPIRVWRFQTRFQSRFATASIETVLSDVLALTKLN